MQYLKDLMLPTKTLYPSHALNYFEGIVYDYYESFLETFMPEAWDLAKVRFGSEGVEFVAILHEGQHVVYGTSIEKFLEWCEKVVV